MPVDVGVGRCRLPRQVRENGMGFQTVHLLFAVGNMRYRQAVEGKLYQMDLHCRVAVCSGGVVFFQQIVPFLGKSVTEAYGGVFPCVCIGIAEGVYGKDCKAGFVHK